MVWRCHSLTGWTLWSWEKWSWGDTLLECSPQPSGMDLVDMVPLKYLVKERYETRSPAFRIARFARTIVICPR